MQRRLVEELKELEDGIQSIMDSYVDIYSIVDRLLATGDKSFEVTFKGVSYNFIYPSDQTEKIEMDNLRKKLLSEIFKECFDQMVDGKDPWWIITAFASGIDTLDMQIEIVKEDVVNRVDENGERITALPLDENNYQVKLERENDKPDQALDL